MVIKHMQSKSLQINTFFLVAHFGICCTYKYKIMLKISSRLELGWETVLKLFIFLTFLIYTFKEESQGARKAFIWVVIDHLKTNRIPTRFIYRAC